jgi:hypothetical protein
MWSKVCVFVALAVLVTAPAAGQDGKPVAGVKVKVEVELRGVLSFTEKDITIVVQESEFDPRLLAEVQKARTWTLDLGDAKDLRAKVKSLDKKTVVVTGSARLLGISTQTFHYKGGVPLTIADKAPDMVGTRSALDLEHRVQVKSLTEVSE